MVCSASPSKALDRSDVCATTETTAHVLSATIALLALHQDEQDDVVAHIHDVLQDGREPVSVLSDGTVSSAR